MSHKKFAVYLFLLLGACVDQESRSITTERTYKYFVRQYDKNDRVILRGSTEPVAIERYSYGFRRSEIDRFGTDRVYAITEFLRSRNAAPVECRNGFSVFSHGIVQGGDVWAVIECLE